MNDSGKKKWAGWRQSILKQIHYAGVVLEVVVGGAVVFYLVERNWLGYLGNLLLAKLAGGVGAVVDSWKFGMEGR